MLLFLRNLFAARGSSRPCSTTPRPRIRLKELLLATFVLGGLFASPASALNSIVLGPSSLTVTEGESFAIQLVMDFDDATAGGGIEITHDSLVSFISFDFDSNFVGNFGLTAPADNEVVQPLEIGFGFLTMAPPFGISGRHVVGTITFEALGVGATQFVTTAASGFNPGPFYGPADPFAPMAVSFGSSAVTIVPAQPVPEPSTALLMFLGLAGLSLFPAAPGKGRPRN